MPQASASDHDVLPAGTRLAEFEIECVLGCGGFGVVYRAIDHALQRRVAIKEYLPSALVVRGPEGRIELRSPAHADTFELGRRSFINEARLLARFDHPSLVKVYRFWEANDTAYMAMPYYEGVTLREARRDMTKPPSEAWLRGLLGPLLGALDVLHRAQVYHRDIAPDNILLLGDVSGEGECQPVLLDFGAARHVIGDHTQTLTAIVKPSFAPIEQYAESAQLKQGPWTDLYALGAVVHYCLTGRPPMPATTRVVHDDLPALRTIGPAIERDFGRRYGAGLLGAIDHALAVRPADRPASVQAWRDELLASGQALDEDGGGADAIDPTRIERTVFVSPVPGNSLADNAKRDAEAYATTAPAAGPARYSDAYARTMPDPFKSRRDERSLGGVQQPDAGAQPGSARAFQPSRLAADDEPDTSAWGRVLRHPIWLGLVVLLLFAALVATLKRHQPAAREAAPATAQAASGNRAGDAVARDERQEARAIARAHRAEALAGSSAPLASPSIRTSERQTRAARREAEAAEAARASSPAELCGGRNFLSRVFCMKRECAKPELTQHPQCARMRQQEEANRPHTP
ncbi:serine/threonine protein kinase [Aquabacterium sp.]|uniref:serine/threonine protein kinase n=1 Tax=Aquabacterium sp. TaxID=1872578 RepID=UPI0035B4BD01